MMGIGGPEFLALAVIALLVLGPEKLPKFAADTARLLRQLRQMANNAKDDVRRELGPELQDISLDDLNPRSLVRKHLLDDDLDFDLADEPDERPARRARNNGARNGARSHGGVGNASGAGDSPAPYDPEAT